MRTFLTAAIVAVFFSAAPLLAQSQACDSRLRMVERLAEQYGEVPTGYGVSSAGALVELLVSGPEALRQTWSIIVTVPGGRTCLQAAGEGWRAPPKGSLDPET